MRCYDDEDGSNYGAELVIGANGNTYIGAGESAANLYSAFGINNGEAMYVCSDNGIHFYVNCNTIDNRKGVTLTGSELYPRSSGGFTLGTSSYKWGQIYSTASSISTSDRNQKHDISDLSEDKASALILGLNPVTYKYNDGTSNRLHWGLIAQDVEELLESIEIPSSDFAGFIKSQKEKVINDKSGELGLDLDADGNIQYVYALRYEEFIAPLVKTVQVQQRQIEELKEQLQSLMGGGLNGMADA